MIEIPIGILILMMGLYFLQNAHYSHIENMKSLDKKLAQADDFDKLRDEFVEMKKKIDVLVLRSGLK